jgi:hypothetical protein
MNPGRRTYLYGWTSPPLAVRVTMLGRLRPWCFLPVTGSIPAQTRTLSDPLGSLWISPLCRLPAPYALAPRPR